ncbi:MAG: hypothetical protein QOG75_7025 [Mycobacterium sp.]|jgi:hypothetical protein|nr:hypothetical protein [Mycobacterium sp.]
MEFSTIDYCVDNSVATITLNRPHARGGLWTVRPAKTRSMHT